MSLEYLEGFSNHGDTADVWILRDEGGKIIAFTMQIFTNCSQFVNTLKPHLWFNRGGKGTGNPAGANPKETQA